MESRNNKILRFEQRILIEKLIIPILTVYQGKLQI
jgi:hypothetical protein